MIFTSLGLLVVAAGLLLAGIAKSSVALLMTSLFLTLGAGVVLSLVLSAAKRLQGSSGNGTVPGGPLTATSPQGQPLVLYVQQAPSTIDLNAAEGNGGPPVVGYDAMTAQQISKLITSGALSDEQLDALREYEAAHSARRSVLSKLS